MFLHQAYSYPLAVDRAYNRTMVAIIGCDLFLSDFIAITELQGDCLLSKRSELTTIPVEVFTVFFFDCFLVVICNVFIKY